MPLADSHTRIDWIIANCRLLAATMAEFSREKPFAGLTVGTAIHLEPKTAALLLTLAAGGARVISTGNLNSTQAATVDHLRAQGIKVIGEQTTESDAHERFLDAIMAEEPDVLLDNGGDLFARVAKRSYPKLRGGTEETTTGRARLVPLREAIKVPVLVINDSPIKQFAENRHAVGQSLFESYMRFGNRSTNGKRVTVFGYGACGRGTAACFRNAFAVVAVIDIDPVTTLEAHLDGFITPLREEAIRSADILITVTGAANILSADDLPLLKDGAILINGGHLPREIDVAGMRADPLVVGVDRYPSEGIETLRLADGRGIHIFGDGHMANLAGPRPLGNSVESMDLGFTLQARCLERVAQGGLGGEYCVAPVPADIDAMVAAAYLALNR
jgi:adenosylhomocysteinase